MRLGHKPGSLSKLFLAWGPDGFAGWGLLFFTFLAVQGCSAVYERPGSIQDKVYSSKPPVAAPVLKSPLKPVSTVPQQNSTPPGAVKNAVEVGVASWYGPGFSGKATASGEIFDENQLTAAHKTLPLGSRVRVTNLENGITVDVAINDRGPFVDRRIIDLSRAAAEALGILEDGIGKVKLQVIDERPEQVTER